MFCAGFCLSPRGAQQAVWEDIGIINEWIGVFKIVVGAMMRRVIACYERIKLQ